MTSSGRVRWVETFADAKPSELVVLVDSYGLLTLALDRQSAAVRHKLRVGSGVTLIPPERSTVPGPAAEPGAAHEAGNEPGPGRPCWC